MNFEKDDFSTRSSRRIALENFTGHKRIALEQPFGQFHRKAAFNPTAIQGSYRGVAFGVGVPDNYRVNLKYTSGSRFVGRAEARNSTNPSLFLTTSLQGRLVDGALLLKQTTVLQYKAPPGQRLCLRGGRLNISISQGKLALSGAWLSQSSSCGASQIRLQKHSSRANRVTIDEKHNS